MDKPTPTRQQRSITASLGQTLGTFQPNASPYPDAKPAEPLARKRNPRALIVAASRVAVDPDQVRKADKDPSSERIQELAASIKQYGLQQPVVVRDKGDGSYIVVAGEGRFTAMTKVLGWTEIEVSLTDAKPEDILWIQIHENVHRTNLHPLDLAAAVRDAQGQGFSLAAIADRMNKSEAWVQKAMTVGKQLGDEAWQTLQAATERPAMDAVYAIAQVPEEAQAAIAQEVVEKKLTRRATEALTDKAKTSRTAAQTPKRSGRKKAVKPFERTIRTESGASVTVRFKRGDVEPGEVAAAVEQVLSVLWKEQGREAA